MATFKCKMCGGALEIIENTTVCECEYCGSKQTVPSADNEKKLKLFDRANRLRFNCEFDKAAGIYESIIEEFPEEAEAYWGNLLCKYGIEYVDDPATGDKVPTCHRSSFESFMDEEDFDLVMENSDMLARSVYREQAKQIEEIRKGIIEVSGKEQPYDIFICYKETDENNERTLDSVLAQDVYDALTEKGYRVFFSRISLEDKLGTEYEPYIFAALNSAKIMLAFGTSYDYYNAVWVKNEWSRYLKLMAKDKTKHLIPCFKGIDAYDMPKEFTKLTAQDLGKVGATQDLLRGIDKLLGGDRQQTSSAAPAQVVQTVVQQSVPATEPLLKRAFMFLEDGEWKRADDFCEQVLNIDPENAQAYLGKLMAELNVKKQEQLGNLKKTFDDNFFYKKVLRFADENLKKILQESNATISQRIENERKDVNVKVDAVLSAFSEAKAKKDEKFKKKLENQLNNKQIEFRELEQKLQIFEIIEDESAQIQRLEGENKRLWDRYNSLTFLNAKEKRSITDKTKENREKLSSLYDEIRELKSQNIGFKSAETVSAEISQVKTEIESLEKTIGALNNAVVVQRDSGALKLNYDEALKVLFTNKNVLNAARKKEQALVDELCTIEIGEYGQSALKWRILNIIDRKALLITEQAVDAKAYHVGYNITWEKCSLRKWLNDEFYSSAFSVEEKARILKATVSADKNPECSTDPGRVTEDNVFLLSITETEKYFSSDEDRACKPSEYAKKHGAYVDKRSKYCSWWLRSPGDSKDDAAYVGCDGPVYNVGIDVSIDNVCVRPAMWISLES